MELKDFTIGVLVKSLNMTEAEVSSLFNEDGSIKDDAPDIIQNRHAESVKAARDKQKKEREDQLARGRRETGEEWEKRLKAAGVELEGATGDEAVEKLKAHIEAKTKPSELPEDQVKTHRTYTNREKELLAQVAAAVKAKDDALAEQDAKYQRERTLSKVKQRAEERKAALKPVLSTDPEKAKRQGRLIEMDIAAVNFVEDEDGGQFVTDEKGARLEKPNGSPITWDEYLDQSITSNYDIPVSEPKGSAGDPTKGTVKGASKLAKPATRKAYADELNRITSDPNLKPEEKAAQAAELKELAKDLA